MTSLVNLAFALLGGCSETTPCEPGRLGWTSSGAEIASLDGILLEHAEVLHICPGSWAASAQVVVDGDATISGDGADATVLDAKGLGRVLSVYGEGSLTLRDLTITGGRAYDSYDDLGLTLGAGGGVASTIARTIFERVRLQKNAAGEGGAIAANDGEIELVHSSILSNESERGGAVALRRDEASLLSAETDWGSASEGNVPNDVAFYASDFSAPAWTFDFAGIASFECTWDERGCSP